MVRYTTNPLTGRPIRINGPTYNRLIIEAYDHIDGRLIRRAGAPSPPQDPPQYLNVSTGRMVQYGTRTYFGLIDAGYELIEDYYLVEPNDEDIIDAIIEDTAYRTALGRRDDRFTPNDLNEMRNEIELRIEQEAEQEQENQRAHAEYDEYWAIEAEREMQRRAALAQQDGEVEFTREQRDTLAILIADWNNSRVSRAQRSGRTLEDHAPRLAELNIALCQECLMPMNPSDLLDGRCKECRET